MKNIIKSIFSIVLVTVLFCSVTFGDGDMSNGGKTCVGSICPGFAPPVEDQPKTDDVKSLIEDENAILILVKELLKEIGIV